MKKRIYFLVFVCVLSLTLLYWVLPQRLEAHNEKEISPKEIEAPSKKIKASFGFYNVENLFDTIDDPHTRDNEFLPVSSKKWNTEKYLHKCKRLAALIDSMESKLNLTTLGLCEIENENCLKDVLKCTRSKWKHVYFNTSDTRGIDQAFLYKENTITCIQGLPLKSNAENESHFREIGFVKAKIQADTVVFLVHHWPSRLGGTFKSDPKRMAAAKRLNAIIDSVYALHLTKIVVMADFNDEPQNASIVQLKTGNTVELVNYFEQLKSQGQGSIQFKSQKYLFDQILITPELSEGKGKSIKIIGAGIFHPDWMHYKNDPKLGPYRTYNGEKYHGGYSDHFPVYVEIK